MIQLQENSRADGGPDYFKGLFKLPPAEKLLQVYKCDVEIMRSEIR